MLDQIFGVIEQMIDFVGQETFFNIVAGLVGFWWLKAQRAMGIDRKTNANWERALEFLEAGVMRTYQEYVKARKTASADGRLTEDEKREARQMAFTFARSYAAKEGMNIVKELGAEMIPVLIEKTVGGLKREASGPSGVNSTMEPYGPAYAAPITYAAVQPVVSPTVPPATTPIK